MSRYVARLRAWWDDGADLDTRSVQSLGQPVVRDGPIDTGLLDRLGNPILRVPDEIGFYDKDRPKARP